MGISIFQATEKAVEILGTGLARARKYRIPGTTHFIYSVGWVDPFGLREGGNHGKVYKSVGTGTDWESALDQARKWKESPAYDESGIREYDGSVTA